ncbi:MAG: sel1 repeat family protein [Deltaproteobacteria bacterium]|jgi:hypothetical protein|nr:sel1 repeat family protein [Deltaproteobacteria bacterium]
MKEKDESPETLFEAGKRFYFPGRDDVSDPDLAMRYFQESAARGYAPAQRLLGICFLEGNCCRRDLGQAVRYLKLAADKKDPQASFTLAVLYAKGEGVRKDWGEAFRILGHPDVQSLPEARALKLKLKQELQALYPGLMNRLDQEESLHRFRLPAPLRRSAPFFWNKLDRDEGEFTALLDLNLKKSSEEEVFKKLRALLADHYREKQPL